jgi:beta-N-acetylhexosaminidase
MDLRPLRILPAVLVALILRVPAAGCLSFWDGDPAPALASRLAAAMTDEELLGQLVILGYPGALADSAIPRWVRDRRIGGVKIFPRNVKDLPSLAQDIASLQALAAGTRFRVPLFVATDQEGGWVRQIKDATSIAPGNLALGAAGLPLDASLTGYHIGMELAALGINMNFAPTADVYANPEASVIGPRSFGSDPAMTGLFSAAYAKGMRKAGVLCAAKHFPGHGSADKDSHGRLPVIPAAMEELVERDLLPYRILVREGIPAIMTGHLAFPDILGSLTPASLSPFFLHSVLRDRLGFAGLVITDDMEMEGVLVGGIDTPTACRHALEAGNDMVLVSHTPAVQERTWRALLAEMKRSRAFRAVVESSTRRVLETKIAFFRDDHAAPLAPSAATVRGGIPSPGAADFFFQSSCRSVTLLNAESVPWRPGRGEKVLLCGQFPEFLEEGERRFPGADALLFPFMPFYQPRPEDTIRVPAQARRYDTVVFCLANFNSLEILKTMRTLGKRIIVISALSPVYLSEVPWVRTAIAVYGNNRDSFRAGFGALAGDFIPEGKLPVWFEKAPAK